MSDDEKSFGTRARAERRRQARADRVPEDLLIATSTGHARRRTNEWDYVIVGSGAGRRHAGGAAGRSGHARVPARGRRRSARRAASACPDDYDVPGFHAFACENPAMSWDFRRAPLCGRGAPGARPEIHARRAGRPVPARGGPGRLHRAQRDDLHAAARLRTGTTSRSSPAITSWRARAHAPLRPRASRIAATGRSGARCAHLGIDPTGHGWRRLAAHREADAAAAPSAMTAMVRRGARHARTFVAQPADAAGADTLRWLRGGRAIRTRGPGRRGSFEGLCYTPLVHVGPSPHGRARAAARRRRERHPDRLHVELDALATRVLFDAEGRRRGVEYLQGHGTCTGRMPSRACGRASGAQVQARAARSSCAAAPSTRRSC